MKRITYAIKHALHNCKNLKSIKTINHITDVDLHALKDTGIDVLVLDYDGVLTAHNGLQLSEEVDAWLKQAIAIFGDKVFVLSNQPKPKRIAYFQEYYPSVHFITAKKKPYPDGLLTIAEQADVAVNKLLLVDDRLLTGGLACVLAGCQCFLVIRPFQDFKHHFLYEVMFACLRKIERLIFF